MKIKNENRTSLCYYVIYLWSKGVVQNKVFCIVLLLHSIINI